jgi:NAD(P)H-dependent FMN reductase
MSARTALHPGIRIGVILASTWRARCGESLAKSIHGVLVQRPGVDAEILDLRDYRLPSGDDDEAPTAVDKLCGREITRRWSEKIHGLDGYIIVTPEYNQVYPGQLKNAIDRVRLGWSYKPVAFVSYDGASAGARAVEQLSGVAVEARMVPVRSEVNVRLTEFQASEKGGTHEQYVADTAGRMIDQLLWWAQATKVGRAHVAPPGP